MISDIDWEQWQDARLFLNPLIRLWVNTWGLYIKHQKHYAISMLIRGISCFLMKNHRMIRTNFGIVDPRVALIYFCDSGSGKGMGQNFYQSVFEEIGLNILSLKKPTPEKLIGSFDENIDVQNRKKGWEKGHSSYKDPIIHGYLEEYDDILFDEAETFFNNREYGENMLRIIRMALDPYGSLNNTLQSETLKNRIGHKYHCSCNIAFLSYHIKNISEQIFSNGIFQRPITFFYRLGIEEMEEILQGNKKDNSKLLSKNKQKLKEELKKVAKHIEELEEDITITPDAESYLTKILEEKLKKINIDTDIGKRVQSFLPRLRENLVKYAGCLAVLKLKKKINVIEIKEAEMMVLELGYESLIRELVIYGIVADEVRAWYKDLRSALGTSKGRPKEKLNDIMSVYWGVSKPVVIQRLKKMKNVFIVTKKKIKEGRGSPTYLYRLI